MQLCYFLKLLFQKSRPYFDDSSLGDLHMHDCAAEFGNPSGHSILAASGPLTALWYFQRVFRDSFSRIGLKFLQIFVWLFILSVIYSRIYTGRHSLDQCLIGFAVGVWTSHFSIYFWKENVFDKEITKAANHFL